MKAPNVDCISLWAEHTYPTSINVFHPMPTNPIVTREPLPSCLDNQRIRVRLALSEMLPHDTRIVEGVFVRRTTKSEKLLAFIIGKLATSDLESAVSEVIRLASEPESGVRE